MHSLDIWPFIARPICPKANNVADFDMDGKPDNISFMIKRIKVHTEDALEDPSYRFPGNYGVEKFLERLILESLKSSSQNRKNRTSTNILSRMIVVNRSQNKERNKLPRK